MANYVLEILDGDRAGEVVPVAGPALRVGRKPGNDLVLADEKTSGVHAEVVLEGDRHVLRDLGSTNGTFLDGKRVTELVLTPGDVVTFGRLRVKFRTDGDAPGADTGDLAMHRLDAGRVRGRSGSVGLLAGLLVVGLGVAGWFWWQGRQAGDEGVAAHSHKHEPLVVEGNRLAEAIAACESEEGWQLGLAGGISFATGGPAHTGALALTARTAEGNAATDFAVLRTKEPVSAFAGHTLTLAAWLRTANGGQAALRALIGAANEQVPFSFRTGSPMAGHDDWTRVEVVVGVPLGCDRVHLEVAALLPTAESTVSVDDVAITEQGQQPPVEMKLAEGGQTQTAIGTGSALAIRSVDSENPAIVLAVMPAVVPAPLQGLQRADLCVLSDLGATLVCTANERGFVFEAKGTDALQFVLPADAANALLMSAAEDNFAPVAADGEFSAQAVLVGERLTRAMLRFDGQKQCRGKLGGGRYRLVIAAAHTDVVLSFRAERQQAVDLLRQAKGDRDENRPGDALDKLTQLATKAPMDTEILAQSGNLRGEILAVQAKTIAALQKDLDEATFFTTRGGFERVVLGVDDLTQLYGERNFADGKAVDALRAAARAKLDAIDGQNHDQQRARLSVLAGAFREAQQEGLAQLVQSYIDRHLGK